MSITYQVEQWSEELYQEAYPLLLAQYYEIATDKGVKPYDPDFEQYQMVADLGMLHIVTARQMNATGHNVLIGYFVCIVAKGLHYSQTKIALNDILYIDPKYRGGTAGYRLFSFAISELKNLGADILTIHMKTDYPFRNLLTKLGFHLTEENWERVL